MNPFFLLLEKLFIHSSINSCNILVGLELLILVFFTKIIGNPGNPFFSVKAHHPTLPSLNLTVEQPAAEKNAGWTSISCSGANLAFCCCQFQGAQTKMSNEKILLDFRVYLG